MVKPKKKKYPKIPVVCHLPLYKNIHKGSPVLILATGPSSEVAVGEDFSRLPVIGINDAIKLWHTPYYFALDRQFIISIQQHRKPMVVFAWNHFHKHWKRHDNKICPAWFSKALTEKVKNLNKGLSFGSSSTYAALHLAAIMGFNPIYLLGNDLAWRPGTKSHVHKRRYGDVGTKKFGYNGIIYVTRTPMIRMKKNFEESKSFFDSKGIKVINISQGILDLYPRKDPKDIIEKLKAKNRGFIPYRPKPGGGIEPWKKYLRQ